MRLCSTLVSQYSQCYRLSYSLLQKFPLAHKATLLQTQTHLSKSATVILPWNTYFWSLAIFTTQQISFQLHCQENFYHVLCVLQVTKTRRVLWWFILLLKKNGSKIIVWCNGEKTYRTFFSLFLLVRLNDICGPLTNFCLDVSNSRVASDGLSRFNCTYN